MPSRRPATNHCWWRPRLPVKTNGDRRAAPCGFAAARSYFSACRQTGRSAGENCRPTTRTTFWTRSAVPFRRPGHCRRTNDSSSGCRRTATARTGPGRRRRRACSAEVTSADRCTRRPRRFCRFSAVRVRLSRFASAGLLFRHKMAFREVNVKYTL